jgi:hypothetical protein
MKTKTPKTPKIQAPKVAPISWNEIRERARAFARDWADESSEDAEAKSFWDGFFLVFGVTRRRVASFEKPVKKGDGHDGYIDLLWKGVLLVEHKSRGKNLDHAAKQARDYFPGLAEKDLPRYVVVSDFARIRLTDLDTDATCEFALADLHKEVRRFGFIAGYQSQAFTAQNPVDIEAAERLGHLHDLLKESGYEGHPLEVLLVRLLFCLFADDTGIFERRAFQDWIIQRTAEDGSDLGPQLAHLFQVLNTEQGRRQRSLDEQLAAFAYVNGNLFNDVLPVASFASAMRASLLECCGLDWSLISPAVFGSLFQSIMDKQARRNLGAHYTSEGNILKLVRPLSLDDLRAEFERVKGNRKQLAAFHENLGNLRFLDPACGCGNFLVIAYRELRLLELDVLRVLYKKAALQGKQFFDIAAILRLDVDQFYGIELEEFPAQIAQVALWLMDHQMNMRVSEEFGVHYARLPLRKHAAIEQGNALQLDWRTVVAPADLDYILGNPPFVGKKEQSAQQKEDTRRIFAGVEGAGNLDYVANWYVKAVEMLEEEPTIRVAFVSTNSITQGEQPSVLWPPLLKRGLRIQFAHRTFQWSSEARGKAAVHCIIVGFGFNEPDKRRLFDYATVKSEPHEFEVSRINPYLVEGPDIVIKKRMRPILNAPEMDFGSKAADFGHLTLTESDRADLISKYPEAEPLVRQFIGSEEFINGTRRYCLWMKYVPAGLIRSIPWVVDRIEKVRAERLKSVDANTRRWADFPSLFQADRQPLTDYLLVPKVSSERRDYIPLGFCSRDLIVNPSVLVVPDATVFHFGVLHSLMHMAWTRAVCGRLESRYQYSVTIVYNNYPWPTPTPAQRKTIETAAQGVLDARAQFPGSTLADLYDPLTMPPVLVRAHHALDKAVDAAYGVKGFPNEAERVAFLFERYVELMDGILA